MAFDLEALLREDVAIAIAVVVATILLVLIARSLTGGSKGSSLVLAGPVNSGKTTLFLQLRDGTHHQGTVSSMQENEASCKVTEKGATRVIKVVDIPGHASFRSKLERALRDARGIVFVLDSVEFNSQKQETADILYDILGNSSIARGRVPVVVACNKADQEDQAFSVEFIKKNLEKQVDAMRKTKAAALSDGSATVSLGKKDKAFSFADLRTKIEFVQVSALQGDIGAVRTFVTTL
jgi:signal recognition particle receptor subunit beta